MIELKTDLFGFVLDPPLILASGILDQTARTMERIANNEVGGIVTKSIGEEPREGHPNPTVVELENGLLNAMGLPNPGIEDFKTELDELRQSVERKPIIGSVFASDPEGFAELAQNMVEHGSDMIELNLSCPHAEGYGASIASDDEMMREVISRVKEKIEKPILTKLPPSTEIARKAALAEESGSDGIVCINTVRAMTINFETQEPILGNKIGGYSGKAIKPIGLRCVFEVYREVDIPIIGCGGINTGRDALEYMLAGASALQIGTVFHTRGKKSPNKIAQEMKELMEKEKIEDLKELIAEAHK
ncbi:MAG: dihydroorotate dehydrogenase [Candidatus Thermoplasmatota archaeon]|nr:dihydroorotate dehydrogenase [Candidatus Thermoplasmatota archaeon]MBS3790331.1 dihydroorotate dehydrogenase [Candidatus Thermoplasmatota archaeon]